MVKKASGYVSAADNTAGLAVSLEIMSLKSLGYYVYAGAAASIYLEVSINGTDWRLHTDLSLAASGDRRGQLDMPWQYVRLRSPTTAVELLFELTAK